MLEERWALVTVLLSFVCSSGTHKIRTGTQLGSCEAYRALFSFLCDMRLEARLSFGSDRPVVYRRASCLGRTLTLLLLALTFLFFPLCLLSLCPAL